MSLPSQQRGKKLNALNKSLGCVLQALLDKKITVELKSEVEVRGTLVHLDAQMNLMFKDCTLKPVQKAVQRIDNLYVSGRSIRYIHFPDEVDITQSLADYIFRITEARSAYKRRMLPSDANTGSAQTKSIE